MADPWPPRWMLTSFSRSLFGYVYFRLDMQSHYRPFSENYREVMGKAVLCIRNETYKFNRDVLESCGYGMDKLTLIQEICNFYPNENYFKKIYYITAFIVDLMVWWHTTSDNADIKEGPKMWVIIFQNNFHREFVNHGDWQGLLTAANEFVELHPNRYLPGRTALPVYFEAVIAAIGRLNRPPANIDMNEILRALRAPIEQRESGDASAEEAAQVPKSGEEIRGQKQPGEEAQEVKESEEETEKDQQEEIGSRPRPHSSVLGGNLAQIDNPCEGTSGKSEEVTLPSHGNRNTRKRKKCPSKQDTDSDTSFAYQS